MRQTKRMVMVGVAGILIGVIIGSWAAPRFRQAHADGISGTITVNTKGAYDSELFITPLSVSDAFYAKKWIALTHDGTTQKYLSQGARF